MVPVTGLCTNTRANPRKPHDTLLLSLQDFSSYLSDGLHLSPLGNEFLFLNLWPLLDKKLSSLPWLLPYWKDVEEAKPELSLLEDGDH